MSKKGTIKDLEKGKLIIAEPFMRDGFFQKSVVLITDYHEAGTVGFVLNRPLKINIKSLISDFPDFPGSVYMGGPVQNDTVHYLHTAGDLLENSREIISGVYWGGDFNKLKVLASEKLISPHDIRFFVGYAGWSPGQLEQEMENTNAWLVERGDPNYIFYNRKEVDLWKQVMKHKGRNFEVIASMPEQSLN